MIISHPLMSYECVTSSGRILANKSPSHDGSHTQLLKTLALVIPKPFTLGTWLSLGAVIIPND